ncbi:phage repressor protein [Photobacterium phosphoreum]|uniref:Phage repressor protein n=1 Tax=Photobacterium phosphoreum TaxID=659 RepID=A0A2T3J9U3_PHOPO|nr:S24 family peptidase [Photobacterium phosphoreum]PSU19596.1 phage repressor protein [Photobacterium phosphoreum]PSU34518.1 phage repressor protein [Photobacterium phosphoreum]PSU45596.1 phage repressor protein [Photobacterium phosphoreum]
MTTLAERLISRRKELRLTQEELAKPSNMTRVTISNIEIGNSTNIRAESLFALAKALNCSPEWLLFGTGAKANDNENQHLLSNITSGPKIERTCPLINWLEAVSWGETNEPSLIDEVKYFPCPVICGPKTFILTVRGDSMLNQFENGDLIYVDPDNIDMVSGNYVVAVLDNLSEATFRRLIIEDGKKYLQALNPSYLPEMKFIQIDDNYRLIGTVVSHVKPI